MLGAAKIHSGKVMSGLIFFYPAGHSSPFWYFLASHHPWPWCVTFSTHVWDQQWVNKFSDIMATLWSSKHKLCSSCFHSGPVMESKLFICSSAAELQQWMQHLEDRRYKSTQSTSPSHCALASLVMTNTTHSGKGKQFGKLLMNDRELIMYICFIVALWWALEKKRIEEVFTASQHMAVGGFSNTAHGPARIYVNGPCHQCTQTGDSCTITHYY